MSEVVNLFQGQAKKIFACYKESDELQEFIQKGIEAEELEAKEAKEADAVKDKPVAEIQKSEEQLNLETLDQPFSFSL